MHKFWDLFDDLSYWLNLPGRIFGQVKRLMRRSKAGTFGPTVQMRVARIDKAADAKAAAKMPTFSRVIDHLERNGINTFDYLHDSQALYFSVRKSQEKWARWLYDERTGLLRAPRRSWATNDGAPSDGEMTMADAFKFWR